MILFHTSPRPDGRANYAFLLDRRAPKLEGVIKQHAGFKDDGVPAVIKPPTCDRKLRPNPVRNVRYGSEADLMRRVPSAPPKRTPLPSCSAKCQTRHRPRSGIALESGFTRPRFPRKPQQA
jgi:hypothetical protein